jgi:hypothetical protein
MLRITASKIIITAQSLKKKEKKCHFHILTPGCTFNKDKRFALVLENTSDNEQFIYFSLKKPAKTGKKLVEMLHDEGISDNKSTQVGSLKKLSPKVERMIETAKELNIKGFGWHHHLLFPDCMFNHDSRYWTLVFEDPLNGEVIKDISKVKPEEALKEIKPLFYAQKK